MADIETTTYEKMDTETREGKHFEVPSLKAIAEKIRRDAIDNTDDEDVDADEISKLANAKVEKASGSGDDEAMSRINDALIKSEQELRLDLFELLKKFFESAFTIIIKRRRLCPYDAFQTTNVMGIMVPEFLHPSSLQYVQEVSKKLIVFMHRNASEGCAIHIMIEKNKIMHVVQRFVFRTMGSLDVPITEVDDDEEEQGINIDQVESHCRASLIKLMNDDSIKPMFAPQYSRWSISLGLKKELLPEEKLEELWRNDPCENFPWKKKLRSLANSYKNSNGSSIPFKYSSDLPNPPDPKHVHVSTECKDFNSDSPINNDNDTKGQLAINEKEPSSISDTLEQPENSTTCIDSLISKSFQTESNDASKIICFPLSSFPITSNFMLSIYSLEYPAPMNANVNHSTFSPRITNRNSPSAALRLSQFRHRLMRQSSSKYAHNNMIWNL